jgi:hypothetical protein
VYNSQIIIKGANMQTYTRAQVAEMLKVSINWLASKKMAERLPFVKDINNRVYYDKKVVDNYIQEKFKNLMKRS